MFKSDSIFPNAVVSDMVSEMCWCVAPHNYLYRHSKAHNQNKNSMDKER